MKLYFWYTGYTKKSPESLEFTGFIRSSTPVWSTRKPLILLGFLNEKFKRYTKRYTRHGKGEASEWCKKYLLSKNSKKGILTK